MRNLRVSIGAAVVGLGLLAAACGGSTGNVSTGNSGSTGTSGSTGGSGSGTTTSHPAPTTSTTASQGSGWG